MSIARIHLWLTFRQREMYKIYELFDYTGKNIISVFLEYKKFSKVFLMYKIKFQNEELIFLE